jgi:hypothetical protein
MMNGSFQLRMMNDGFFKSVNILDQENEEIFLFN